VNLLRRFAGVLLAVASGSAWTTTSAFAQEAPGRYISPSHPVQRGRAPEMKVRLIRGGEETQEYAVIFSKGDEAFSGLLDFAEKYHVTSGHFTAIGALSGAVLAWFDPQKKMYREIPISTQVEVLSMIGNFAVYQGKPTVHTHMVVGHRDGTTGGGHVIEAVVFPTLEVFVTTDAVPLHKRYNPETDLTLIDPTTK
jgi:predicted DNA-binding protein with PD1-like motif